MSAGRTAAPGEMQQRRLMAEALGHELVQGARSHLAAGQSVYTCIVPPGRLPRRRWRDEREQARIRSA